MSYVRLDDEHENGRLTTLRERLESEVRMQTGLAFPIFQDRNDIAWGDNWKVRIEEGIDAVTFFIPIITPGFFQSSACRSEFERFREREQAMDRADLILPLYYVEADEFSDEAAREADAMARELVQRQYFDWRPLRFEPFTSAQVGKGLASMARQVKAALPKARSRAAQASPRWKAGQNDRMQAVVKSPQLEKHTPSPRTEPPTFVVDAMHRGDYPTLTKAIAAVPPGARLLVRPGYYAEGIVMDKPLEIIGDGPREEIIVASKGSSILLFDTTMGRVTNLTLRQESGGKWFGVHIVQGRVRLEGCDIATGVLACVAIGCGADPVVRNNRIHDGKREGVFIYDKGRGTFENNDIFGNALTGFAVTDGGAPVVRDNHIHRNGGEGISIIRGGHGTYERNVLWDNARGAWFIDDDAGEVVRRDDVEGPPDGGI